MRVLFNTYPMAFHTPGGGEIQLLAYQEHLPNHGVEVTLFDQWNPRFLEHDLVHFFSCIGGSHHFCAFVRKIGLPLVISSSLWITEETKSQFPADEIRHQLSLAERVVVNSDIECETLARVLDLPPDKFVTVYNGIDDVFFEPCSPEIFRQSFGINERFVLNVGNIEPRKNQLRLIEAMKQFPDLRLVLIGHVRDPGYARECIRAGKDKATLLGPINHSSELLRSAYSACEAFVAPSLLETPGLAALEARAMGCRVVITKVGSTREYFGDSVHYVDPTNVESISHGLALAMEGPSGIDAGTFVREKHGWTAVTRKLCETYSKLL